LRKIKDRMTLGLISGMGGNIAKLGISYGLGKLGLAGRGYTDRAAGIFVPGRRTRSRTGSLVGFLADETIAAGLGVGITYMLSSTGKDHAVLKGAMAGQGMWAGLYGMLATLGVTRLDTVSPMTAISHYGSHIVYGAITAWLVVTLGDPSLFNGGTPITAGSIKEDEDQAGVNPRMHGVEEPVVTAWVQ
jgi:hypothetical protein